MTGLVPSAHMEPLEMRRKRASGIRASKKTSRGQRASGIARRRNLQKKSFRTKSFKEGLQGEKERQGLREDEICRKRASGIRASKKGFKGKKSVRDWAKTKFAEKELQE